MSPAASRPRARPRHAAPRTRKRILVASHGHPDIKKGGAEIAAYTLFQALTTRAGAEAWFLGCQRGRLPVRAGPCITQPLPREHEFIYAAGDYDWFRFANRDAAFPRQFEALLRELQPDVLHMHHYLDFGIEAFLVARRALPRLKIVLTLHEYLLICHHFGQMVKTTTHALCHAASPAECHACFPDIDTASFHLRERYVRRFLDEVDAFVAPSRFLAGRYRNWGLPAERLHVIANLVAPPAAPAARRVPGKLLRAGFFGQISPLKGIAVLLDAAAILERDGADVVFDIHGTDEGQPDSFRAVFSTKLAQAGRNVRYHGPYGQDRVDALMQSVDVVVVPSIWWENAPTVIAEALRNARPVVCSDIGGMAESVTDGVDGFHFPAGSPYHLAAMLSRLGEERELLQQVSARSVAAHGEAALAGHLALYRGL